MCVKKSALRGPLIHFGPLRRPARGAVLLNDAGTQFNQKLHGRAFLLNEADTQLAAAKKNKEKANTHRFTKSALRCEFLSESDFP